MPVFIWANGACSLDSLGARNFLTQIASYGYLVISQGRPGQGGQSSVQLMNEAVTWAANGAGGLYNVRKDKIMTAGYSCGGAETWGFINDNRVATIGILNSGGTSLANTIRKPMFVALGGPSDVAYNNVSSLLLRNGKVGLISSQGESDYRNLPSGTASWKGNLNSVGHGGTYYQYNGGLYAKAIVKWLGLVLRGDASQRAYFENNAAVSDGWTNAVSKNLNNIPTGNTSPTTTAGGGSNPTTTPVRTTTAASGGNGGVAQKWAQCGGQGWTGPTVCVSGSTCTFSNQWYSQCL